MQRTITMLVCAMTLAFGVQRAESQGIMIDANDVQLIFAVGNTITYRLDTLTTSVDIGAPGETAWDFGGLNTTSVVKLSSVPVASTPYAASFPQATHALRDTAFTYSFVYAAMSTTVTLKGIGFVYYSLTSTLANYGLKGAGNAYLFGNPYPAQGQWLNSPASIEYNLPLGYEKTWTSEYTESISGSATSGPITLPFGPIDTRHTITYTVDAFGMLTVPGAKEQGALRIRKVDSYVNSSGSWVRVGYIFLAKSGASVQITANDISATSGVISVSSIQWTDGKDASLPVELASFTATAGGNGTSVNLEWTTLSETNNLGFYIQRSGPDDRVYVELPGAFVAGHGTTIVPQKYSFLDMSGGADARWYRLKQVDLDGSVHFSEPTQVRAVAGVQEATPTSFELGQNYPNPFNPSTTLGYTVAGTGHEALGTSWVRLSVFDMLGREVAVLVNEKKDPGRYSVTFDASGLSSGMYLYRMQVLPVASAAGRDSRSGAGQFTASKKLLIVR